ncbi:MAG: FAM83 family protein [Helicobacter sp.]|nr:FAM83 family protein [Helicobacter sp.]
MRHLVKIACIIVFAASTSAFGASELFMMPKEQKAALSSLLSSLKAAKSSIDIAIYSFTNREIAKALRDVAAKGVKVRVIYDESSNEPSNASSTIGYLAKLQNVEVCTLKGNKAANGKYFGIMHMKVAIVDDSVLFIGSANWSKNAFENNYETLLRTTESALVDKSKATLAEMRTKCREY